MLKTIGKWLIRLTTPLVHRLADAYDLRVARRHHAFGEHPLIIGDTPEQARNNIPKTVYFNTRSGRITLGRNVGFGEDVKVLTGKHLHVSAAREAGLKHFHVPPEGRDIRIDEGAYIGTAAIIIGPVHIGEYAVVGAGAVVTHDVPAYAFVAGVPAKIVSVFERPDETTS